MKVLIDTNIILDVLLKREPFYQSSKEILNLCESRDMEGLITTSSITDLFYITRKSLHDTAETYKVIGSILNIVKVLTVTNSDVEIAFQKKASDFEDCLMAVSAESNKCDGIITRNTRDFISFGMPLYTPEEYLSLAEIK